MQNNPYHRRISPIAARLVFALACAAGAMGQSSQAHAQSAVSPTATAAPPPASNLMIPANTVVELEMVDAVSSKTSKRDDFFKLRVAADVKSGDVVLIPAGTPAVGQIVHAQKSGGGGKAGELILAARYIDTPQGQIKLRSTFGAAGKNRVQESLGLSIAIGAFALFVHGKELELPAGSPLSARLAMDTSVAAP